MQDELKKKPAPRWAMVVTVLVLLTAALALRLYDLGAADLTEDEHLSAQLPLISYPELFYNIGERPPLSFLFQKVSMQLAGASSPMALRLPSVLEGVLGVLVVLLLARDLGGNGLGLAAGALAAFSQFHIVLSRDARYYPLLMLLAALFLWAEWRLLASPKAWLPAALLPLALALAWTHHVWSLFLLSALAPVPLVFAMPPWRGRIARHPRPAVGALAVALTGGVLLITLVPALREQVSMAWRQLVEGGGVTENFDVAPAFLIHRFAEVMAVPTYVGIVFLVLFCVGVAASFRTQPIFALLGVSILLLPFVLVKLLQPPLIWRPKYFVFMLPVMAVFLAWGSLSCGRLLARRLPARGRRNEAAGLLATVMLMTALLVPNVPALAVLYQRPTTAVQMTARVLAEIVRPGETVVHTFSGHGRLLEYYLDPSAPLTFSYLAPDAAIEWNAATVAGTWFVHLGKGHTSPEVAQLMLSPLLSRTALHQIFLAYGPNIQGVVFGENALGWPSPEGRLELAPGMGRGVDVLVPREGMRAVILHLAAAQDPPLNLLASLPGQPAVALRAISPDTYLAYMPLPFGRQDVTITNRSQGAYAFIDSLALLPVLGAEALELPAWDFYALEGGNPATVWVERVDNQILLRDLRDQPRVVYRFFSAYSGEAAFELTALNDAPGANRYTLIVPTENGEQKLVLAFDEEDGRLSTRRTVPVALVPGVYSLVLVYEDLVYEEKKRLTDDFTIQTPERIQSAGVAGLTIVPLDAAPGPPAETVP
jgi:hypothetical protein